MKRYQYMCILVGSIILAFSLGACSSKKKEELQLKVNRLASEINENLVQTRQVTEQLGYAYQELFTNTPLSSISVDDMNVENGGRFAFFENTMYYKTNEENEDICSIVALGARTVDTQTMQRLKLVDTLCPQMRQSVNELHPKFVGRMGFYAGANNYLIAYPFYDFVSTLPLKLDFEPAPWYQTVLPENNPERGIVWTPEPFVSIGPDGWILTVLFPVFHEEEVEGLATADVHIYKMGRDLLEQTPHKVFLMSAGTQILNSTPSCEEALQLRVIEDYDYLEQLQKNPEISDEFKLSHEEQSADLQRLAQEITANTEFTTTIHGKEYFVTVGKVAEVELYIVGLLEL